MVLLDGLVQYFLRNGPGILYQRTTHIHLLAAIDEKAQVMLPLK